ncbi:MAG TPA: hypothetical protein VHL09_15155 [Dehalococcoidia bacterium]|nr:hypothetical protein [Dehalococcoidia bacterium]
MAKIKVLSAKEVDQHFAPVSRRAMREEEMKPYRDAVQKLGDDLPGGVIDLEESENPRMVMMRLHRAAHDHGIYLRFQRHGKNQRQLRFRLQTSDETARLKERGAKLAQARRAKR